MKTGSDKFIWQGLYLSFGMGGTPISLRQELRQQRIVCEANRSVACAQNICNNYKKE